MVDVKHDVEFSKELKENIINKLIENEKCMQNGEKRFTETEMNTILDWTMSKYA